jgi:glycosyltransferase involved in cell wall biosynthesis
MKCCVVVQLYSGFKHVHDLKPLPNSGSPAFYNLLKYFSKKDLIDSVFFLSTPRNNQPANNICITIDDNIIKTKILSYKSFKYYKFFKKLSRFIEYLYNKFIHTLKVINYLNTADCDVLYTDRDNIILALIASNFFSIKVIVRILGVQDELHLKLQSKISIQGLLLKSLFSNNKIIKICTNNGSFSALYHNKYKSNNFHLLFNGCNSSALENKNRNSGLFKILYISRMEDGKGHFDFLNVLASINSKTPFIADIVGDGILFEKIITLSKQLNLDDKVNFIGNVDHKSIEKYLSTADLFVSINYHGSVGNTLIEASSFGVPSVIVATNTVNVDLDNFFYVIKGDNIVENSVKAIEEIMSSTSKKESLSKSSVLFYEKYIPTWEKRINNEILLIESN